MIALGETTPLADQDYLAGLRRLGDDPEAVRRFLDGEGLPPAPRTAEQEEQERERERAAQVESQVRWREIEARRLNSPQGRRDAEHAERRRIDAEYYRCLSLPEEQKSEVAKLEERRIADELAKFRRFKEQQRVDELAKREAERETALERWRQLVAGTHPEQRQVAERQAERRRREQRRELALLADARNESTGTEFTLDDLPAPE